jgi:hypothetical protein
MFLFRPFRAKTDVCTPTKRQSKTPGTLYRILSDEFERLRPSECSCKMPIVFEAEDHGPDEPNWTVETLWCGSHECRRALAEVIARNASLFELKKLAPGR